MSEVPLQSERARESQRERTWHRMCEREILEHHMPDAGSQVRTAQPTISA